MIGWASQPLGEFGRRQEILVEKTIEKEIRRGKERPAECGGVIIVADCDVIAPHQHANRGGVVLHPRIVEPQDSIEMRLYLEWLGQE